MTISSTVRRAGPFIGNGTSTVFPFGFKIFDKTNVKVLLTAVSGALSTLVLDSDYSVTLNADQNNNPGGTITYPLAGSPMISGFSLLVLGNLAISQPTDITNSGGFYPNVIEDMVDRATIQIQQLATDQSLSLSFPENEAISGLLPAAGTRANTLLAFDGSGNPTTQPITASIGAGVMTAEGPFQSGIDFIGGTTTTLQLSQAYGARANVQVHFDGVYQGPDQYQLFGTQIVFNSPIPDGTTTVYIVGGTSLSIYLPADGETVPAGTKMYNRINDVVSVRDFGARGTNSGDDTAAIQAAINSGAAAVFVPPGIYPITNLTNPNHVRLFGAQSINSGVSSDLTKASWLYCTDTSNAAITLRAGSSVEKLAFFHPNQVTDLSGAATPIPYPAAIRFDHDVANALVDRNFFANAYIAVDNSPVSGNTSLLVTRNNGYALFRGVTLSNGVDVTEVSDNKFTPNMYPGGPSAIGAGLLAWVQNNGIGFEIFRQDGGKGKGNFAFGYYTAYSNNNSFTGWTWENCSADGCRYPLVIAGSSNAISFIGGSLVALNFVNNADSACDAITVNCTGRVMLASTRIGYASRDGISAIAAARVGIYGVEMSSIGALANGAGVAAGIRTGVSPSGVHAVGNTIDCGDQGFSTGFIFHTGTGFTFNDNEVTNTIGQPAGIIVAGSNNFSVVGNTWRSTTGGLTDNSGVVNKQVGNNLTV